MFCFNYLSFADNFEGARKKVTLHRCEKNKKTSSDLMPSAPSIGL